MKPMYLINSKHTPAIIKELNKTKSLDQTFTNLCGHLGLYGVAFFGHGNKYQKAKVRHLWNSVLFIASDFKEVTFLSEKQKNKILNSLINH